MTENFRLFQLFITHNISGLYHECLMSSAFNLQDRHFDTVEKRNLNVSSERCRITRS